MPTTPHVAALSKTEIDPAGNPDGDLGMLLSIPAGITSVGKGMTQLVGSWSGTILSRTKQDGEGLTCEFGSSVDVCDEPRDRNGVTG